MATANQRVVTLAAAVSGELISIVRQWRRLFIFVTLCTLGLLWAGAAQAKHERSVPLTVYNTDGVVTQTLDVSLYNNTGGATVAVGDTDGGGKPEFVIGSGYGNKPEVRVLSPDGKEIKRFLAFDEAVDYGLNVAVCDLDRDGRTEIVAALQAGGAPEVRIFHSDGTPYAPHRFFAYDESFKGGVSVGCGDVDHDGVLEIITAPGPTGGPHIRWWYVGHTATELAPPAAEPAPAAPVTDDEATDTAIIIGRNPDRPDDLAVRQWRVVRRIVRMAAETEQVPAWVTGQEYFDGEQGDTRGRLVTVIPAVSGDTLILEPLLRGKPYERVVHQTYADLTDDGVLERITVPGNYVEGNPAVSQDIVVDLSEQRLYVYENGLLKRSLFVSSGIAQYPTPTGSFTVAKAPSVLYQGYYGPNNPGNYDYGWVKNNLRFKPHYFIHTAYWHNDFGHRRSHGCVNVKREHADWLYEWADEGAPVTIRD